MLEDFILFATLIRPPPLELVVLEDPHEALMSDGVGVPTHPVHRLVRPEADVLPRVLLLILPEPMSRELIVRTAILVGCLALTGVEDAASAHAHMEVDSCEGLVSGLLALQVHQSI